MQCKHRFKHRCKHVNMLLNIPLNLCGFILKPRYNVCALELLLYKMVMNRWINGLTDFITS